MQLTSEQLRELRDRAELTRQQKDEGSSGGGFQSYLESLDSRTSDDGFIDLTIEDNEQIRRYIQYDHGNGGYERLFRRIFGDVLIDEIMEL